MSSNNNQTSPNSHTTPEQTLTPVSTDGPAKKAHSCVLCAQRKVKCDKIDPCSNCVKHGAECVFKDPAPPRRRKRKLSDGDLRSRVERYEKILKDLGVSFIDGEVHRDPPKSSSTSSHIVATGDSDFYHRPGQRNPEGQRGQLIVSNGKYRYIETPLYRTLGEDLRLVSGEDLLTDGSDAEDEPDTSSSVGRKLSNFTPEALLLGGNSPHVDIQSLHPPEIHVEPLWRYYCENIDPIVKILHIPTIRQHVFDASRNLDSVSKPLEALMFAIYAATITSLDEDECQASFGERRSVLLAKYRAGAQQALAAAKFLRSSDLMVLQAYTLHLTSIRYELDPQTLWALAGVAVRCAQRLGLHKESANDCISPFDMEMRRRLYWQVAYVDMVAAQASGCEVAMGRRLPRIKPPANLNDADMDPGMKELPPDRDRPTEIMFMRLRSDFAAFIEANPDDKWAATDDEAAKAEREQAISDFQKHMEMRYLRFMDPLIPIHSLTATLSRFVLVKMRLMNSQRNRFLKGRQEMTQADRDLSFSENLKLLEYDNAVNGSHITKRFLWHSKAHFQVGGLVAVLDELRYRTTGPDVEHAWQVLSTVYKHHSELTLQTRKPVFKGVGSLAIKAWDSRATECAASSSYCPEAPWFIQSLQQSITEADASYLPKALDALSHVEPGRQNTNWKMSGVTPSSDTSQQSGYNLDFSGTDQGQYNSLSNDLSPIDWSVYEELMLHDYPGLPFSGTNMSLQPFIRQDFNPTTFLPGNMN